MNKFLTGAISVIALAAASSAACAEQAKYVFMMIGDGMATTQRNAAAMYLEAVQGKESQVGIAHLVMDSFPAQGMSTTYSTNALITDSAAAGTALSTGKKTKSGVINMDPEGKEKYIPLTKTAHAKGYKIGIVTSVSIDHATPAAYYAHAAGRSDYYDIALQMLDSDFEYFGGGAVLQPTGINKDKQSFYDVAKSKGYTVTQTRADFEGLKAGQYKIFAENPVRADGNANALPYAIDVHQDDLAQKSISLAEFTQKGIDLLKGDNFFMMVEGGKIDWAGHANDPGANIHDTLAFDDAVRVAYDFYRQHPDETLIIVTGDHETGGLSLGFAGTDYSLSIGEITKQKGSHTTFTDTFAKMIRENPSLKFEDVLPLIEAIYGLTPATMAPFEIEMAKTAFARSLLPPDQRQATKNPQDYLLYGSHDPLTITLNHITSHKAGLGWATYAHTGVPVPVSAIGVGAQTFNGFYDNTDIAKKTMALMGL